jgi:hypothetical protein
MREAWEQVPSRGITGRVRVEPLLDQTAVTGMREQVRPLGRCPGTAGE